MANLTLHIPKTCTAVRVEEADGEIIVRLELPDYPSQVATASEARATAAGLSAEERKRAVNAARQKRYRDRKRNADRNADRNASVTNVTQTVTPSVTCNVIPAIEGKNVSILDDAINENINPINGIQEKETQEKIHSFLPVQKSVTRNITRNAVTVPEGQERIPFLPAGAPPELDLIHFPKLAEAIEKYFEYRAFHGAPKMYPDYESKFWQFVQSALREFGEETAAEIMDRNRRDLRWFTLKVPADMKLLPTAPPPEPEPTWTSMWNTPDPNDPNEIARKLALGRC